ncbi:unnamed protein product [Clonostachys solani]|uniref:Uncharacterized protein n=1 Tax=Clonostachys solani TaxID=160281 RepID=A0A9P0EBF0_9HYPO|nr:unnamed protein product [Clonostachys solani]
MDEKHPVDVKLPNGEKLPSFNLVDSFLLEKIDRLFACNAGDYVDLPQLVVVGQQSSGKSSVLEGLTGLPFPRDSGLCTRFATQITFRRSNESKISASIIPSADCSDTHRECMESWGKKELDILDAKSFAAIMREVIDLMGVGPSSEPGSPAFSKDVLVLEIAGPDQEHFSVIDVPGTFKKTTEGQTTTSDIALVFHMVKGYMENPRSVMLTVVPCTSDIANEDVVQLADDLDPYGNRTLGVLTKPDLVDDGAEGGVLNVMNGKSHRLKLGWHLVRNLGQRELKVMPTSRGSLEDKFFKTKAPWNAIDKARVGVAALRIRLQKILTDHIRREFPKVKADIRKKLQEAEKALRVMGPKRQTAQEQSQFLTDIASEFQDLANSASRAQYVQSDFFGEVARRRLATVAVNRGEIFAEIMTDMGHEFDFADEESDGDDENEDDGDDENEDDEDDEDCDSSDEDGCVAPSFDDESFGSGTSRKSTRLVTEDGDIVDYVTEAEKIASPRSDDILEWLTGVHRKNRGFELGSFDCALLIMTMQHQARKWKALAKGYISDMIAIVHTLVLDLLHHVVPDKNLLGNLVSVLSEHLQAKYLRAMEQTDFLLRIELEGTPATYNHVFTEVLNKCRAERVKRQLESRVIEDADLGSVVRLDDIVQTHPLSNNAQVVQEIHDILKSYYELARKRFVDNVRMQAADHFLVTGPNTPLKLFSPRFVSGLTPSQLDEVAGEEQNARRQRARLEKEIGLLKECMTILR